MSFCPTITSQRFVVPAGAGHPRRGGRSGDRAGGAVEVEGRGLGEGAAVGSLVAERLVTAGRDGPVVGQVAGGDGTAAARQGRVPRAGDRLTTGQRERERPAVERGTAGV